MAQNVPDTPEQIGLFAKLVGIERVPLKPRPPDLGTAPASPTSGMGAGGPRGETFFPTAAEMAGAPLAGQCPRDGSWYFWPVTTSDGVPLLQCISCWTLYLPA